VGGFPGLAVLAGAGVAGGIGARPLAEGARGGVDCGGAGGRGATGAAPAPTACGGAVGARSGPVRDEAATGVAVGGRAGFDAGAGRAAAAIARTGLVAATDRGGGFASSTLIGRVSGSSSSSSTTRLRIGSNCRVRRSIEMAWRAELGAPRGTAATTGTSVPRV